VQQVFIERREEEADPDLAYTRGRQRAIAGYLRQGKDDAWIGSRLKGLDTRNEFTETLAKKRMEADEFRGNERAASHCRTASQITRDAIQRAIGQ
jgi:hypothetical protein